MVFHMGTYGLSIVLQATPDLPRVPSTVLMGENAGEGEECTSIKHDDYSYCNARAVHLV